MNIKPLPIPAAGLNDSIDEGSPDNPAKAASSDAPKSPLGSPSPDTDLNQAVIQILKILKMLTKTRSQHSDKHKLLQEINLQTKLVESSPKHISLLQKDEIIILARDFLLERGTSSSTRREATKFLNKLVSGNPQVLERFLHFKVHFFLARNLEKENKAKDPDKAKPAEEVKQCLKLLKTWILVSPNTFPLLLARSLCTLMATSEDKFKKLTLEIIRLLAFANTELMDGSKTRDFVISHVQIPKIFSYFTDIDRTESNNKKENALAVETKLKMASATILALFQRWNGIFYLVQEKHSVRSLVEALGVWIRAKSLFF